MDDGTPTVEVSKTRRQIIERPRLTRLLDASTARIITLVAPAGYGKTTLARQWVEGNEHTRTVWYTASPADQDVAAYITGLSRAFAGNAPEVLAVAERVSASADVESEIELLAGMFAEVIAAAATAALVIDDYDWIASSESGEAFTLRLIERIQAPVLVCSRVRPTWATPKRILYGEIVEVGRNALALTTDETHKLMPPQPSPSVAAGLVSLSDGWPAVIGLASRLDNATVTDVDGPSQLHAYFADELFGRLSSPAQRAIQAIAVAGIGDVDLATELIGTDNATSLLDEAHQAGFITWFTGSEFELQPLMRDLLLEKTDPRTDQPLIDRVVSLLLSRQQWVRAGDTIMRFQVRAALPRLMGEAASDLLSQGRLGTLDGWLEFAKQHGITAPEIDLAQAEVAFRRGTFLESRAFALAAATTFEPLERDAVAAALIAAGRAAHALSDESAALELYDRAATVAPEGKLQRAAQWGAIACAVDLEIDDLSRRLSVLRVTESEDPLEVMIYTGRLLNLEARSGSLRSIDQGRAANALAIRVADPLIRSSFRNVYAYVLALSALYDEAEEVIDAQADDCGRHRLTFATPHILSSRALVAVGRAQFDKAEALLKDALTGPHSARDPYAVMNAHAIRSRLNISRHRFDEAMFYPPVEDNRVVRSMHGELLAWHSLAAACQGDIDRMDSLVEAARAVSSAVEVQVGTSCAQAIAALRNSHDRARLLVREAMATTIATGNYDGLICALRGSPELLSAMHGDPSLREQITRVAIRAQDTNLGPRTRGESSPLSPRELDVLALIIEGLTNQQIADRLFISLATAKLHVHHILQKLDVSSRAAAAVRGLTLLGAYAPEASDESNSSDG